MIRIPRGRGGWVSKDGAGHALRPRWSVSMLALAGAGCSSKKNASGAKASLMARTERYGSQRITARGISLNQYAQSGPWSERQRRSTDGHPFRL